MQPKDHLVVDRSRPEGRKVVGNQTLSAKQQPSSPRTDGGCSSVVSELGSAVL